MNIVLNEIISFMKDWSENAPTPKDFYGYIDWLQTKKGSTDVCENKRYAIALNETDELIGMVGMGLEDTVNEIEVAYFMCEKYQRRGYVKQSVKAITDLSCLKKEHRLDTFSPIWKVTAIIDYTGNKH